MESSDEFETLPKSNKRLPSNDEDLDEPECKKNANDKNLLEENCDEALQANDPYINHFKCELPEISAAEKLKFISKKFEWENIGTFIYSKPQIPISSSKEPSVENKIETSALKKNLYSTIQTLPLFNLENSPSELSLFSLILNYFDVLYMKRTYQNGENLRLLYTLHVLNHVLKTSARIIHHNSKLAKNPDEEYRDQGFTRTTCIILVPFRHDCHQIVSQLFTLLPKAAVRNRKRFEDEYGSSPKSERIKKKPQDHEETFEGNTNEDFKIGLCIKNKSITLYSEFYKSDLIIASPLGLRQVIGAEGEKDRDFDFLSSVEILVIDRADVLFLQNSLHLLHVLKHMNLLPKESHGCNFFRVKMYALNGMAKFYRQTILLSSVENTWFETFIFQNQCFNYSGYLSSVSKVKTPAIQQVLEPMKMCFRWFETSTLENEIDDRFNFFITKVLPDFKDNAMAQTLVYIPSYFDFVRLRNYFREMELSCVMICEYSKKGKIAQARDVFFKGYRHFMLYTERAHFYSRYHIKGIQHIIFYQLPLYPSFFHELCNSLMDSNPRRKFEEKSCTVLASKFELLQMKHIVGLTETKHMHNSKKKIFVKYTDK